ncbi:hypothetical protein LZ686_17660, partial [Paracoccus sp. NFXS7]|uniref:hypothetical protein n=1 Tax=Paracoccus sp. NFXS7 TaxID=2908653 RepID=UPI0032DE4B08
CRPIDRSGWSRSTMPFGIVSRTNGVPMPHPFPPQGFSFLSKKENSGACCFRFDIVDLPRDEDQQTAKTELTSVPSFQAAPQSVRSRPF